MTEDEARICMDEFIFALKPIAEMLHRFELAATDAMKVIENILSVYTDGGDEHE